MDGLAFFGVFGGVTGLAVKSGGGAFGTSEGCQGGTAGFGGPGFGPTACAGGSTVFGAGVGRASSAALRSVVIMPVKMVVSSHCSYATWRSVCGTPPAPLSMTPTTTPSNLGGALTGYSQASFG